MSIENAKDTKASYADIIKECKQYGVEVTWRKLNYYKSLGLLPKAERLEGDKRGFYSQMFVLVLLVYNFLQNHLMFTLNQIKNMIDKSSLSTVSKSDKITNYAIWINASYDYVLQGILKERDRIGGVYGGVTDLFQINRIYKTELLKTKIENKPLLSTVNNAKKWAENVVKKSTKRK